MSKTCVYPFPLSKVQYWIFLHTKEVPKESAIFHLYFGLVALEGSSFTRIYIFTTAGVKCCMAGIKCRRLHLNVISVLLYFFWPFGINDSNACYIENRIPLKAVLGACEMLHFHLFILVWLLSRNQL